MSKSSAETMKREEMKVLDVLEQHAKNSISELSKRCGLSSQKVARIIKNLEKKKLIWGYSAIADGTLRDFKHYVLLVKRNTVPFDISFKKELVFDKLDDYLPDLVKIENIYLTHGSFGGVVTFYAVDLLSAKKLIQEISKKIGNYFEVYLLLETLFPMRKFGLKNPQLNKLVEYL
ncbi:Winged helix-turn-helix DNA-binding protein [uncultured archaeon]|nr:Winged helix-turn-helix DNA-binding protein [uncultured archaeon]